MPACVSACASSSVN
jgi:hypothetical protein